METKPDFNPPRKQPEHHGLGLQLLRRRGHPKFEQRAERSAIACSCSGTDDTGWHLCEGKRITRAKSRVEEVGCAFTILLINIQTL